MTEEIEITEKEVKGIVTRSDLDDADFVVNPYTGCQVGCEYCYARFMKRFSDSDEDWGDFVEIKENAEEVFQERDYSGKTVLFSSVTDPYQPIEAEYEKTRELLKKFIGEGAKIDILTKSKMVERDIDVLKQIEDVRVGVSISTLDREISSKLEPYAAPPEARLETLETLNKEGIETYVFNSPILPHITDTEAIIQEGIDRQCADRYLFENLNASPKVWPNIKNFLQTNLPQLVDTYEEIYFGETNYWEERREEIEDFCKSKDLDYKFYFH